jgi:hypothetical protein
LNGKKLINNHNDATVLFSCKNWSQCGNTHTNLMYYQKCPCVL